MNVTSGILAASDIRKGDTVRLSVGWRQVLDCWQREGHVHVVAEDATALLLPTERVAVRNVVTL